MKRLMLASLILIVSAAFAQVTIVPGSPEQVNRALSESPGSWADEGLRLVVEKGIFTGYADGTFEWREEITRAEAALAIARLIQTYDLESFDADELDLLRKAVAELADDLAGFHSLIAELEGDLAEAARNLDRQGEEIDSLWNAINALDMAPEVFDATELWRELHAQHERITTLEGQMTDLEAPTMQPASSEETAAHGAALELLTAALAQELDRSAVLERRVADLEIRVAELEGETASQRQLSAVLTSRLDNLAAELAANSARVQELLDGMQAQLDDHEERIARLEASLLPDRNPFYVSLALYGSAPDSGLIGQVTVGHDALYGNLGGRASVDIGFGAVPTSISGNATFRTSLDQADGYAGIGLGASFEEDGAAVFGEFLVGVSVRVIKNLGVYAEGRYRPYFDGTGAGLAALGGGIQIRF